MKTKEAIERVRSRFDKWALDEEDLEALRALGLVTIESEDERIRKKLLEYFTARKSEGDIDEEWYGLSYEEIITYLKKQKEQKPAEHLIKWGEGEDKILDKIIDDYEHASRSFAGYEARIGFLKALKNGEYGVPQKSEEWSERDEIMIQNILGSYKAFEETLDLTRETDRDILESLNFEREWLKSLRPIWKPSEEQMKALDFVLCHYTFFVNGVRNGLVSLHDDLKKQL